MQNRGAHLRLNIVANKRQIFVGEALCPSRIARDEHRDVVDKTESSFQRATGIKSSGLLRPDRQVVDHQFGGGILQLSDDLFASGFLLERQECAQRILVLHVWRVAVQNTAHFYNRAGELDLFTENLRAIGRRKNRPAYGQADLAPVDLKPRHDFNATGTIAADLPMHQSNAGTVDGEAIIKVDPLYERTGAVSNAHDCDSNFSHF